MEMKVSRFLKPEELTSWADRHEIPMDISREDAEILLRYMTDYGYAIGSGPDGNLYRQEIAGKDSVIEPYTMDEVIDMVNEWNYERILDIETKRSSLAGGKEGQEDLSGYEKLKCEEARLDRLFDQTIFGQELDVVARAMAEALVNKVKTEGMEQAAAVVTEGIREYSKNKRGR